MKSKIISISDDQNTITHESGLITTSKVKIGCEGCIYFEKNGFENCRKIICSPHTRTDKKSVIFVKQESL